MLLPSIWQQKGGACVECNRIFFSRCCGWCSLPLHHQMVRRWQITAAGLGSCIVKAQKEIPQSARSEGFCFALNINHIFFAYGNYSICLFGNQYAWSRYFYGFFSIWHKFVTESNSIFRKVLYFLHFSGIYIKCFFLTNTWDYWNCFSGSSASNSNTQRSNALTTFVSSYLS